MYYAAVAASGIPSPVVSKPRDIPMYCNNCGKYGHSYSHCKNLITSYGAVAFRWNPVLCETEYLMICRKNTLGFMDFIRGKYMPNDINYIYNMITQMTESETAQILGGNFEQMWKMAFGTDENTSSTDNSLKHEMYISQEKFRQLSSKVGENGNNVLTDLVAKSQEFGKWTEPEWGFPKGRRNYRESDYECAIREFCEETGYSPKILKNVLNVVPYEEIFMGSNYKSYKHRYYLVGMSYTDSLNVSGFEKAEVSKMEWKTYEKCLRDIRVYNLEKKRIIQNINTSLGRYLFVVE